MCIFDEQRKFFHKLALAASIYRPVISLKKKRCQVYFPTRVTPQLLRTLKKVLGKTFPIWETIIQATKTLYPEAKEDWSFPGEKYGWSFRLKDKKRAIIYLLPQERFFTASLVFGQKATTEILQSKISENIKEEIKNARVYAEGRGLRIDIKNKSILTDLKELIKIKISY